MFIRFICFSYLLPYRLIASSGWKIINLEDVHMPQILVNKSIQRISEGHI